MRVAGWRKAGPVSGELRLRNGAAGKRINGGCQVVVDRATERSEAGRNEVSSILWTQVNGVVKRKRETYATNTQTV
jgi:hypothetical protein